MLQIFLIGSISGFSYFLIGCSKRNKHVVGSEKKEKSVKIEPCKLYRNEKTNPIPPKTYEEFAKLLERALSRCSSYAKGENYSFRIGVYDTNFDASGYKFVANPTLNRYPMPSCLDKTRVVLENRKNDYINASWLVCDIKEYRGKNILTQGPLKHTIPDFWAMIYQEKVEYIVMFCSFIEKGVEQCAQYYPINEGGVAKYDNFEVKYVKKEEDPVEGVTWTILDVTDSTGKSKRTVNHIYVSWWPEKTAPEDPKLTIELYKWLMKKNQADIPMVFHCNNGIGRSATFAAIYFLHRLDFYESTIGYHGIEASFIRALHHSRLGAIETSLQYCFFMCCLFELFIQEGRIKRTKEIDEFMSDYNKYAQKVRECVRAGKEVKMYEIFPPKSKIRDENCPSCYGGIDYEWSADE